MISFFDYFQITSLLFFLFVVVTRGLYLRLVEHINPIAIGRGENGFQPVFELSALVGMAVWVIEILLYSFHSTFRVFPSPLEAQLIDSTAARVIGVLLVIFGLIILIWAFISFGKSWRVGLDVNSPGELVTTGIFAISRNPIYVFLDLWFAGVFLINGTLIFLLFALLAIMYLHFQILREEKFLAELYGAAYKAYCAGTGRYLTFIG